jgi:predicted metal-dependent HD superfamily phosphohydrolase
MIKHEFFTCVKPYAPEEQGVKLWDEAEKNYSAANRHYHNLTHLNSLVDELKPFKDKFSSWKTVVFAIVYHDIIYNTLKSNNEERSADMAVKRLSSIAVPKQSVAFCRQLILATKKHARADVETNLFTDADLAILGSPPDVYKIYSQQIRQEYALYPDLIYYPGRKKVLLHFLEMESIYKSEEWSEVRTNSTS